MLELAAIARALERIAAAMELRNGALMQPQTTYVFPSPCAHDWRQSTAGWRCERCGILQDLQQRVTVLEDARTGSARKLMEGITSATDAYLAGKRVLYPEDRHVDDMRRSKICIRHVGAEQSMCPACERDKWKYANENPPKPAMR